MYDQNKSRIAVIGGGLVGPLQAMLLQQNGYTNVSIYESRSDPRISTNNSRGWSFDLAVSKRGLDALEAAGLRDTILSEQNSVKVYSRFVHNIDGTTKIWKYGKTEEDFLLSLERKRLNEILLDEAERRKIPVKFQHKLLSCNAETGEMRFETGDNRHVVTVIADFIFGCDGAYSTVRTKGILPNKRSRMNFSQVFAPEGYREIHVPPTAAGNFALDENHLHVWPRNDFMLMCLPNPDKSLTMTLFMPIVTFERLQQEKDVIDFFETHFPDALSVIGGPEKLAREYFSTQTGSMVSIKCEPHNFGRVLLLGDSAHAMVPFYGQGVNAGFEDCLVFQDFLTSVRGELQIAAHLYSLSHCKDSHAIVDLSLYNHEEMRKLMNSRLFWLTSKIKKQLHALFPTKITPLYSMVAFSRIPYDKAKDVYLRQSNLLHRVCLMFFLGVISFLFLSVAWATSDGSFFQSLLLATSFMIPLLMCMFVSPRFQWNYEKF